MSEKHLSKGCERPPKIQGKLRLYGMLFCPYVLRIRLVLLAKNIPHDIVYVDLQNKPEWLFELNPKGQVPILDDGSKIVTESLDIFYYLEEKYPEPKLCSGDTEKIEKDKELIKKIDDAISVFYRTLTVVGKKKLQDVLCENELSLVFFEEELTKRGIFFNGNNVGFVDYMTWPWVEKLPIFNLIFNEDVAFPEKYKNLKNWRDQMLKIESVKATIIDTQRHYRYIIFVRQSNQINVNEV